MTDKRLDKSLTDKFEPGEEALSLLIKEAGVSARSKKKKAMDKHFKKLRRAIIGEQLNPST